MCHQLVTGVVVRMSLVRFNAVSLIRSGQRQCGFVYKKSSATKDMYSTCLEL